MYCILIFEIKKYNFILWSLKKNWIIQDVGTSACHGNILKLRESWKLRHGTIINLREHHVHVPLCRWGISNSVHMCVYKCVHAFWYFDRYHMCKPTHYNDWHACVHACLHVWVPSTAYMHACLCTCIQCVWVHAFILVWMLGWVDVGMHCFDILGTSTCVV